VQEAQYDRYHCDTCHMDITDMSTICSQIDCPNGLNPNDL